MRVGDLPTHKRLLAALAGNVQSPPPVWLMRQAGRYLPEYRALREQAGSFLDLCYTPEMAAQVTLQPVERFGMDGAILFADILLVCQGLGCDLEYREGEGPVLSTVRSAADVAALSPASVAKVVRPVFETIRLLRQQLPDKVTLIGFAGAPWTVASYMVEGGSSPDHKHIRDWALSGDAGFDGLMDVLVDITIDYLLAQIEAGAEAVQLFESWAGSIPEGLFSRYCTQPVARIVEALTKSAPQVPVIVFPRLADQAGYAEIAALSGVSAVSMDTEMDLAWAVAHLQDKVTLQGGPSPEDLVAGGDRLKKSVEHFLQLCGQGPYVFNLGHGIVPQTPPEHVADLVRWVRQGLT